MPTPGPTQMPRPGRPCRPGLRRPGLRCLALGMLAAVLALVGVGPAEATSRIKDIVEFEGVRPNMLVGYGLAVGLDGTGDSINGSPFTEQSLIGMLERLGINTRDNTIKTNNVAAVMVTATLPAFTRQGSRIDVTVSSLGDADSLLGGTLLVTPLLGADGEVYAVAQGSISVGGFSAGGEAETITQGVPTSGRIPDGGIVEREIAFALADLPSINLALRNPDFTTARRIMERINSFAGADVALATDPATVRLTVPPAYVGNVVALLTDIEQLEINPDQPARVVIDERTGIIVMGENVRISTVAVAQGNLTVRITETPQVSQPPPLSDGETTVVPRTTVEVDTGEDRRLGVVDTGLTLQELVQSLNALGIGPRDMISILQTIKAAGALQADLEVL